MFWGDPDTTQGGERKENLTKSAAYIKQADKFTATENQVHRRLEGYHQQNHPSKRLFYLEEESDHFWCVWSLARCPGGQRTRPAQTVPS